MLLDNKWLFMHVIINNSKRVLANIFCLIRIILNSILSKNLVILNIIYHCKFIIFVFENLIYNVTKYKFKKRLKTQFKGITR